MSNCRVSLRNGRQEAKVYRRAPIGPYGWIGTFGTPLVPVKRASLPLRVCIGSPARIGRMGLLSRLEAIFERLFEAPAGRMGATLQPVSLEKRIERAMDTNKSFHDDGIIVPNHYDVHLNPADFAAFESYRGSLEDDLAHRVLNHARHERYTLVARPRVRIVEDPGVPRRDIRVAANVADDEGRRQRED